MVVMENNICGMGVGAPARSNLTETNQHLSASPPPSNRWYDHMAAQSAAAFQQFGGTNGFSSTADADIADAYFKCNNAAAASTYFSQMQGAYGSMGHHTSQHGKNFLCVQLIIIHVFKTFSIKLSKSIIF